MAAAYTWVLLAWLSDREGDLAAAERGWLEVLSILETVAPEGLEVAVALDNLGYLALWRGDTATAQERLNRSEAIHRSIATAPRYYAGTLNKLALLAEALGELERAETLKRQVVALNEQLAPGSRDHGGSLMNLAATLITRGELATAEDLLRQSVKLIDKPEEDPWVAAGPHANLGYLALYRGDLSAAQSYFDFALSRLKKGPESIELAGVYSALAEIARKQRRFAEARDLEKSALEIIERLAPGSFDWAARLQALARIEQESGGDLGEAEALLRRAEAGVLAEAADSPVADDIRRDLGRLLVQTGRLAEAGTLYRRILTNLERRGLAGTRAEAEIRNLLGDQQRRQGDLAAAAESFCRATRILDLQRSRLGGSLESRSWFEAETQSYFFDCLSALADRGLSAEAFQALEAGKARVFLQLLGERDLRIAGLPPELKAERTRLDVEYDKVLSQLSQPGVEEGETAALRARLEDIKAEREAVLARLRLQSPRLADLQAPAPLGAAGARRALDPSTALLAYAVGPEQSYLFVVTPGGEGDRGLEMYRLPIGRLGLETEIEAYRRLLTDPGSDLAALTARASRLYDLLLRPARKRLAHAERILISADGPLHLLPWAALRRRGQYLAQWRPIHLIGSMTVYEEIRRRRGIAEDPATWRLVAFGDARYPKTGSADATVADSEVRSALRRGLKLESLPATRDEIREIAKLFPGAEVYLGEEATEERAKQASSRADLLHFAGHGLIDERFPLDSSLALTIPAQRQEGRDNGLLQAWEVFESFRLSAHLVTLSACDTAVGREMGGEGLLGLTRAFQFAGARTVLSSLWNVSDASTATLMKRFYSYLRQGETKDAALRSAQLDLLRSRKESLSHPYYWAGFSLYGDWR
ncbi:MAG TPA: CHAT domain-containing protein [Thermoanaerobaculia bacterium]